MRSPVLLHVLIATLLAAGPVSAQDAPSAGDREIGTVPVNTGDDAPQEELLSTTYSTIGLSKLSAGFSNVKDAVSLDSTLIGLRVPTFPWVGIELNASFTMIPGQVDQPSGCGGLGQPACPSNISSSNDPFSVINFGVYGVGRTPGKFFGVAKLGYRYLTSSLREFADAGNGTSWTAGVGYRWARDGFVELGYSRVTDQIDAIGVTFSYSHDR